MKSIKSEFSLTLQQIESETRVQMLGYDFAFRSNILVKKSIYLSPTSFELIAVQITFFNLRKPWVF